MTPTEDPEQRIADLEKQVADARRIADLERQLAEARSRETPGVSGDRMSGLFAALQNLPFGTVRTPGAPVDTRLSEAPRRIPWTFVLAEMLPFRWWYVFALFMVAIPPVIVWITNPRLLAPAAIATLVAIYFVQFWTARTRLAILRWGRVATVTGTELVSRGTYYSGTTYSNVWLPQAHGWAVTRQLWSGPSTKTAIRYALDGQQGELTLKGRAYDDGVILADGRNPRRALCVSSFAYDLHRDAAGDWVGRLRPRLMAGMAVWLVIVVGWLGGAVAISTGEVSRMMAERSVIRLAKGESRTVTDSGPQTVYCNDGHLTVGGGSGPVTVHGHCTSLSVSGIDGVVTVDSVDTITLNGIDNHVAYHSGAPRIVTGGMNNVAVRE